MGQIIAFNPPAKEKGEKKTGVTKKPGSKKLYVDLRSNGIRIVKSSGLDDTPDNRDKLQAWVDHQKDRIKAGTFVFAKAFPSASQKEKKIHAELEGWNYEPGPESVLFREYVEKWRKEILSKESPGKQGDFNQAIDCWLIPHFGKMRFQQITGVMLRKFIPKLTNKWNGKPLSASRIRNILIPFRAIWDDACEEHRWELSNPFEYVKKNIPKREKNPPQVLRFDEWMKVREKLNPFYVPHAETMIMTGMIGSEIAGLREKDIFKDHLKIRNSIVNGNEKDKLKTKYRKRNIPITDALRSRIESASSQFESSYVYLMKSGRTFDVGSFGSGPWERAFEKAGIDYQVTYVLRHSFAAWSLAIGMHPNKLVALMGHGPKQMVYEVYGNYVDGLEKDTGKILAYFGKDFLGLK